MQVHVGTTLGIQFDSLFFSALYMRPIHEKGYMSPEPCSR